MSKEKEATEQVKVELKAVFNRWFKESDLDAEQLAQAGVDAIEEWVDEDIIEFTPE